MRTTAKAVLMAMAVVACWALAAGPAAAEGPPEFKAEEYPADVTVEADPGAVVQKLHIHELGNITCSSLTAKSNLEKSASALTATGVSYTNCHTTFLELPTTIAMNGCHYELGVQSKESESTSSGHLDLECTTKKNILIDIENGGCIVEVFGGQQFTGVTYHNVTIEGQERLTAEIETPDQIEVAWEGGLCGEGAEGEADYTGRMMASAENEAEEALDLTVFSESTPKGSADFWADEGAVQIDSAGEGTHLVMVPGVGNLTCEQMDHEEVETSSVHATSVYEGESPTLTAEDVEFTNCHATILQFPVTVDMNSCGFTFHAGVMVAESATTSEGEVSIECKDEPDSITVAVFKKTGDPTAYEEPICMVHLKEQTLAGVTYHDVESGGVDAVTTTVDASGIHVEWEDDIGCDGPGTTEAATYEGETLSVATDENEEPVESEITGTSEE